MQNEINMATKNERVWNANETEEDECKGGKSLVTNETYTKTMQDTLKVAPLFDYANTRWLL